MKRKLLHSFGPLFGLSLFIVALWVIHNELKEYRYHDIVRQLRAIPAHYLFLGLGLTKLNYLMMTGYDILALWYIRFRLPYSKISLASFIGYAFSNNIGLSMLAGGSVRYRLYSSWGLSAEDITKVVAFCSLTLWMGFLALGVVVFILEPMAMPKLLHLPFLSVRFIGLLFLSLVAGYLLWSFLRKKPLKIFGWKFPIPSLKILLVQIAVASMDWLLAGSILYILFPPLVKVSFMGFIGIYLLAQIAGLVSQIPGGFGVFETVIMVTLSEDLPASAIFGSLLAYRVIYYLIPLGVAAVMLGTYEILEKKEGIQRTASIFGQWITVVAPHILSLTTFVSGIILLFSGATPAVVSRLSWLKDFLLLPIMEFSHFAGSIIGFGLLILARGIQQRLDAAYVLTAILLGIGIILSILKGLDYEEAAVLLIMLLILLPCRKYFYRKAYLLNQPFTPAWITAITIVLLGSIWLGIFSYKHVEYSGELWWRFTLSGDASRFLRATVGAIGLALIFAAGKLLHPSSPEPELPDVTELKRASAVVKTSQKTYANLALLGDKEILFSKSGNSFIMYGREGRIWIALRDSVGLKEERTELVWEFREICDRHEGWTIFYEVGRENLHLYLDLGLTIIKIGEEASVLLEKFSLEGGIHKKIRYIIHQVENEGGSFDIIPVENVPSVLPELRRISDTWLAEKNTREKRFSLGFFSEEYMKRFPAAIIWRDGEILAFANIWPGSGKEELSIDLMRYLPDASYGIMDYLFTKLMLWGKQEGYKWFNLGMAPLSGLENHALAPLWSRLGAFIFRHGEHFYNFQGLRQYKEKFDPEWEPKYLAAPGGFKLPLILTNLATLISGGLKGVVAK